MSGRREQNSAWAKKRRKAKWMQEAESRLRCPARLSRGLRCNTPLESRFVGGETVPFCPTCERKARGVCIDCHTEPVEGTAGRALRCLACKLLARRAAGDRFRKRHPRELAAKERRRHQDNAAERNEYKRLYRQSRPLKTALHKRAYAERYPEKIKAYHAAYRERKRAERAERERLRARGELPPRTCLHCDTVISGRAKVCTPCKTARRAQARAAILERVERAA